MDAKVQSILAKYANKNQNTTSVQQTTNANVSSVQNVLEKYANNGKAPTTNTAVKTPTVTPQVQPASNVMQGFRSVEQTQSKQPVSTTQNSKNATLPTNIQARKYGNQGKTYDKTIPDNVLNTKVNADTRTEQQKKDSIQVTKTGDTWIDKAAQGHPVQAAIGFVTKPLQAAQSTLLNVSENTVNAVKGKPLKWNSGETFSQYVDNTADKNSELYKAANNMNPYVKNALMTTGEIASDPLTWVGGGILDSAKGLKAVEAGSSAYNINKAAELAQSKKVTKLVAKLEAKKPLTTAEKTVLKTEPDVAKAVETEIASNGAKATNQAEKIVNPSIDTQAIKTAENNAKNPINASPENHIDNRTYEYVKDRKVKAFQFEHPELHEYYKDAAKGILYDLNNSSKGERFAAKNADGYITGISGTKRNTTDTIARLLDSTDLGYNDIEKALTAIINDHGQENYAAAKKVELVLDDILTKGYKDIDGISYKPNSDYIYAKENISEYGNVSPYSNNDNFESLLKTEPTTENVNPKGTGAAEYGFDPYSNLQNKYGTIAPGEKASRIVDVPLQTADNKFVSQTVRTIQEAKATPDSMIPSLEEATTKGLFSFEKNTDKGALSRATETITNKGYDIALKDWTAEVRSGKVSKDLTAQGQLLYNAAANAGDGKTAVDIATDLIAMNRNGAQATQAVRLLKKMSPEYQLYGVQRSVQHFTDELIAKYGSKAPNLKIDETLASDYLKALKANDEKTANEALNKIYKQVASQVPSTFADKWNAWRYMAMLANPRTHIKNILGNAFFMPVRMTKNAVATGLEKLVIGNNAGRTKSILNPLKDGELIKSAWKDYASVSDQITEFGKYDDALNKIDKERTIFKTKGLETIRLKNSAALNLEDQWFSQPAYAESLASYMKANKLEKITDEARVYAIREAKKATYRDANAFSDYIGKLGKNRNSKGFMSKAGNLAVEGLLPFKRTPANIVVRGLEYSPAGLIKGLTTDLIKVAKNQKTAAEAIDQIAAGLTGSGILALGAFMAHNGLITSGASGDDKLDNLKDAQGIQDYSLVLGNHSYSIDWLAPESMPLFVGVALYNKLQDKSDDGLSLNNILNSFTSITDPVLETSMLKGINDTLSRASNLYNSNQKGTALYTVLSQAALGYLGQAYPTLLGQTARSVDATRRTYFTDKKSGIPTELQYFLQKKQAATPIASTKLQPYVDVWGREQKSGNAVARVGQNFLSPGYLNEVKTSDMETELQRLYKDYAKENQIGVLPTTPDKSFKNKSQKIEMTANEYTLFKKTKGQYAYSKLTSLVSSSKYQSKSDKDKASMVNDIYKDANDAAKEIILKRRGVKVG